MDSEGGGEEVEPDVVPDDGLVVVPDEPEPKSMGASMMVHEVGVYRRHP